jgi:hypothetical protein
MFKAILAAASAVALTSSAMAADLSVPPYEVPGYEGGAHPYEYGTTPPAIAEEPAPPIVVRPPVIAAPPPVMIEEYPVYAAPRVYLPPPVYAYAGPVWRGGWGYRHHFHGGW